MASLAQSRRFELGGLAERLRADFDACAADETAVAEAIRAVKARSGYLMDPHTACGLVAARTCMGESRAPMVVLSTAHPAKFPDALEALTGARPELPPRLSGLLAAAERYEVLDNDAARVKTFVAAHSRALAGSPGGSMRGARA
jgi:threonine synthase